MEGDAIPISFDGDGLWFATLKTSKPRKPSIPPNRETNLAKLSWSSWSIATKALSSLIHQHHRRCSLISNLSSEQRDLLLGR
ncbi:unnamed protein product [Linum trigynum]|uniref:Uncharacterized protein n=1 Tax=Linum trigynum TaxID=586398 RepID=A0AAV2EPY4_9ROSI